MQIPRLFRISAASLNTDLAALVLRIVFGGLMIVNHGWPKLQTYDERSQSFFNFLGLGSATSLSLAIFAEVACAALVVVGLATRWALIPLMITMLVAVGTNLGQPFMKLEAALLFIGAFVAIFLLGSGRHSVEQRLGW